MFYYLFTYSNSTCLRVVTIHTEIFLFRDNDKRLQFSQNISKNKLCIFIANELYVWCNYKTAAMAQGLIFIAL